eukprot:jgi/Orpsp1_1/1176012/evm.model.c7180000056058.1
MFNNQINEDNTPRIGSDIIKKKETIIEYSSEKYHFKLQYKDDTNNINDEIIVFFVEKEQNTEQFIYEKIMKYKDFIELGELFKICNSIEDVYDTLLIIIEEKKIFIKEINNETLTFIIKFPIICNNKPISVDIKLSKRNYNTEEIIDNLKRKINALENENSKIKEQLDESNRKINALEDENSIIKEQLDESNRKINNIENITITSNGIYNPTSPNIAFKNVKVNIYVDRINIYDKSFQYKSNILFDNFESGIKNQSINVYNNNITFFLRKSGNMNVFEYYYNTSGSSTSVNYPYDGYYYFVSSYSQGVNNYNYTVSNNIDNYFYIMKNHNGYNFFTVNSNICKFIKLDNINN